MPGSRSCSAQHYSKANLCPVSASVNIPQTGSVRHNTWAHLYKVVVVCGIFQLQLRTIIGGQSCQHAVEDVVVPLIMGLVHDARLLQQVLFNFGALYHPLLVEVDVNVLAKATGVVISDRLGIAKSCK